MTRTAFPAASSYADEWSALSTRLRELPITTSRVPAQAQAPALERIVIRVRVEKVWSKPPALFRHDRVTLARLGDRFYSWICQ